MTGDRRLKGRSKPKFKRQESWRYVRVSESWRRPRGKSSRMRISRRGWPQHAAVGYKGPRKYRGLHPSGLREILIHRPEELEGLSPEKEAVMIAATVGERKRMTIIEEAQRLGLRILNQGQKAVEAEALPTAGEAAETPETIPTVTEEAPEESGMVSKE